MDEDDRDLLGEEHDDDVRVPAPGASTARAVAAPEALALASLVLAVVSVLGVGLLNGSAYLPPTFGVPGEEEGGRVAAALLGAALALLPAGLGVVALRRLPEGSPSRATAGAGVLVAVLSLVLRLIVAVQVSGDDTAPYLPF